jgi:hypothetical protein
MRLAAHGLAVDLPRGWDGRIYRRREADPTLHAASFELPGEDGDFGSGATGRMPQGGVFFALKEYRPGPGLKPGTGLFASNGMPLPLDPSRFHPRALQVGRLGQAGMQHFFTSQGRPFCLYAVIAAPAAITAAAGHAEGQAGHLSRILSSLTIHRTG